jgi:hypothetical protein
MIRRLIAIAGMLAFAATCLPGLGAPLILNWDLCPCCKDGMCPMMHHVANGQVVCGMDTSQMGMGQMGMGNTGTSVQACPGQMQRYTADLTFMQVGPATLTIERRTNGVAPVFAAPNAPDIQLDVASPPPRFALA